MEAVPRLPMIHFDQKISPEKYVDFASKLKQLIASVGEDAASFEKEIKGVRNTEVMFLTVHQDPIM